LLVAFFSQGFPNNVIFRLYQGWYVLIIGLWTLAYYVSIVVQMANVRITFFYLTLNKPPLKMGGVGRHVIMRDIEEVQLLYPIK
jgi:hypothetical protein